VFIRADSRGQIETALAWAMDRGFRPVIVGGSAAASCLPLLQESGASVILTRVHRLPSARHLPVDQSFTVAAALEAAGVPFAIGCEDEPAHERGLAHNAATAAAHGLSPAAALRAITRSPAEIIGVGDRLGSLDAGRSATFFLCDGDPLETASQPLRAWIDGRELDLGDRQKRLHEKYREKYRRLGQARE
jgi:cytosine/adenosine deaminase-related metal-dependent hydrolase